MQRKFLFRVWDKAKNFLLPTTKGLTFSSYEGTRYGVTNYIMNPERYLVTVLCLETEDQKVYGLDVLSVFSKDYKDQKEAADSNANIRIVLVDQNGFVKVDGEEIHVTRLSETYNFLNHGFSLYTEAFATRFRAELEELSRYEG